MKYDVSILSTDDYVPEEITIQDIPEHYFIRENGEFLMASTILETGDEIDHLINFLFQNPPSPPLIYRNEFAYIMNLTAYRDRLIDFKYLENHYDKWLAISGRQTSMSEYGMLIDFIGFTRKAFDKKNCLLIVSRERYWQLT